MNAQLEQPHRPTIETGRDAGLGLLFRFLIASFAVVGVVLLVQVVGHDWILAPAMAIHLALTYVVLHGIFLLVGDGAESDGPKADGRE